MLHLILQSIPPAFRPCSRPLKSFAENRFVPRLSDSEVFAQMITNGRRERTLVTSQFRLLLQSHDTLCSGQQLVS